MRILFLITDLHIGGACSLMINNAVELVKRGHAVNVIYFGSNEALLNRVVGHGIPIQRLNYKGGLSSFIKVSRALIKFIKESDVSLIHGNLNLDIRFGFVASIFTGRPLVVTLHSLRFAARNFGTLKKRILRAIEDRLLMRAKKLIAVSVAVKKDQPSYLKGKTEVIYSGVPFFSNGAESGEQTGNEIVILHVGRIDPVKNQLFTLELVRQMTKENIPVKLIYVGRGVGDYAEMILAKVNQYNLNEVVEFAGPVEKPETFYRKARFVIVPSHSESFGLVAAESMQLGIVVIASNVPGLNELMTHGVDGFYYTPNDVEAVIELIMNVHRDLENYNRVSGNAVRSFQDKFTIERSVTALLDLYNSVTRKKE